MEIEFHQDMVLPSAKYEYLDHTADVQLHAWGEDLKEAFEQCGIAMFGYMTELETVDVKKCYQIEAQSDDLEGLLFRFLDELLFLFSAEPFLICKKLEITTFDLDTYHIVCSCYGEPFDLSKHPQGTEVKAITYSAMQIILREDEELTEDQKRAEIFMAPRKKKESAAPIVEQDVRLAVETIINNFMKDPEKTELVFPNNFDNTKRRYVHEYVKKFGLKSKSHGKGALRVLTVSKMTKNAVLDDDIELKCTESTYNRIFNLLKSNPLTHKEKCDLQKSLNADLSKEKLFPFRISVGQMNAPHLIVPPYPTNLSEQTIQQRISLPIFEYRSEIIETIRNNRAVVISGETGSGKTTQVPQYLLEDAAEHKIPYRIICTQPRRLSAISISERVAQERNEILGQTVGYQIRLESKISPSSNLIYCTNGVLLRCLMSDKPESVFKYITHIIVDEVHERDKFSDFLLISLKRALKTIPHLKVILMSATIDSEVFTKYFHDCPLIEIPGKMFDVDIKYLEDILVEVGFTNERIEQMKRAELADSGKSSTGEMSTNKLLSAIESIHIDEETREFADEVLDAISESDDENMQDQFIFLVEGEGLDVDYFHSTKNKTALMIGVEKCLYSFISILLQAGANPELKNQGGISAYDLAQQKNDAKSLEMLNMFLKSDSNAQKSTKMNVFESRKHATMLLDGYLAENMEDSIDHTLLCKLIFNIHTKKPEGSILVFLPGYADILEQAEKIEDALNPGSYKIFMLHSNMQTGDQKGVFNRMPSGVRKIVLATNLAETSITIDDVVYVIDTGRVKQQTFDAITGSSQLAMCWSSKACSKQRAGRAGRCQAGICYRMFSTIRFDSMDGYTLPELLRVPLTDICIQAKLIEKEATIEQFLEEALQPPSVFNVKESIKILQAIGALDSSENLTNLGLRLGDLPIDVRLGKMLLYGVMFRCLDPILTIVSALSTSDPFTLPTQSHERGNVKRIKHQLAEESFSDHLILLRVFQKWSREKTTRNEKRFCQNNYLRFGTMDMIAGVRSQILGHLRSIGLVRPNGPGNIRDLNQFAANWALVKACIVAGLYPNIAHVDRKRGTMMSRNVTKMGIHMSSVVKQKTSDKKDNFDNLPTDWIVFEEKVRISRFCLTQTNTVVTPIAIALFTGLLVVDEKTSLVEYHGQDDDSSDDDDDEPTKDPTLSKMKYLIDDWLNFTCDTKTAYLIFNFKQKLSAQLLSFLHDARDYFKKEANNKVLFTLNQILADEEAAFDLPCLQNINEKPRAINISYDLNKYYTENSTQNDSHSNVVQVQEPTNFVASPSTSYQQAPPSRSFNQRNNYHHNQRNQNFNGQNNHRNGASSSNRYQNSNYQQKLHHNPPQRRYFIVKAASREQILDSVKTSRWHFSDSIRSHLVRALRQQNASRIFILFSIPLSKFMCCLTELYLESDHIAFRLVDERQFNFSYLRNTLNSSGLHFQKYLDELCDGEELPKNMGDFYYNLIVT
uniref:CSON008604 protein n=1 Tax=Culicoides sonorensis TaxID=179676 RepID=A0A336MYU1_CULSO